MKLNFVTLIALFAFAIIPLNFAIDQTTASSCIMDCEVNFGVQVSARDLTAPSAEMTSKCAASELQNYNSCQSKENPQKTACYADCDFYRQDPCYGECESDYNACKLNCDQADQTTSATTCIDTYIKNCYNSCITACSNVKPKNCDVLKITWQSAREAANKICWAKGSIDDREIEKACQEPKQTMQNSDNKIKQLKSETEPLNTDYLFKKSVLDNGEESYSNLQKEYTLLKNDYESALSVVKQKREALSWSNFEENVLWSEALAASSGMFFGTAVDVGAGVGNAIASGHVDLWKIPAIIMGLVPEYIDEFIPGFALLSTTAPVIGTGPHISEAREKMKHDEEALKNALSALNGAKGLLNAFEKSSRYENMIALNLKLITLRYEVDSLKEKLRLNENAIKGEQIVFNSAKSRYEFCLSNEQEKQGKNPNPESTCDEARRKEKTAETAYDKCIGLK